MHTYSSFVPVLVVLAFYTVLGIVAPSEAPVDQAPEPFIISWPALPATDTGTLPGLQADASSPARVDVLHPVAQRDFERPLYETATDLGLDVFDQPVATSAVTGIALAFAQQQAQPDDEIDLALYDVQGAVVHTFYQGKAWAAPEAMAHTEALSPGLYYVQLDNQARDLEASRALVVAG